MLRAATWGGGPTPQACGHSGVFDVHGRPPTPQRTRAACCTPTAPRQVRHTCSHAPAPPARPARPAAGSRWPSANPPARVAAGGGGGGGPCSRTGRGASRGEQVNWGRGVLGRQAHLGRDRVVQPQDLRGEGRTCMAVSPAPRAVPPPLRPACRPPPSRPTQAHAPGAHGRPGGPGP
jgi:hypothetical protein